MVISASYDEISQLVRQRSGQSVGIQYKGPDTLTFTYEAWISLPVISRLISLYSIMRRLGLTDSHLGLVLAISATQVPFSVSLMASIN